MGGRRPWLPTRARMAAIRRSGRGVRVRPGPADLVVLPRGDRLPQPLLELPHLPEVLQVVLGQLVRDLSQRDLAAVRVVYAAPPVALRQPPQPVRRLPPQRAEFGEQTGDLLPL